MYRAGLSRGRIAELTGRSPSTVSYHLRAARAADPGLRSAHDEAAAPKTSRVTLSGAGPDERADRGSAGDGPIFLSRRHRLIGTDAGGLA